MNPKLGTLTGVLAIVSLALGCTDFGDGPEHDETEVITTVSLTFAPEGGGASVVASFRDADGDGGMSGTAEPIALERDTVYALSIAFLDELDSPPEDITEEVQAEAEAHQVFVFGSAVTGPAAAELPSAIVEHAYADAESSYGANVGEDLPVGIRSTVTTRAVGTGELTVMLRHMPELNGQSQKAAGLAEAFASGEPLPGEIDANVTFDLTVE